MRDYVRRLSTPEQDREVINDARRGRSMLFWRRAGDWPHDAMGYRLLAHAILDSGRAMFPDWTGNEPGDFSMPTLDGTLRPYVAAGFDEAFAIGLLDHFRPDLGVQSRQNAVEGVLTDDEWLEAERLYREHMADRRRASIHKTRQVHAQLSAALAGGTLSSAFRIENEFRPIPMNWWVDENINAMRFLGSQADPDDWKTVHAPSTPIAAITEATRPQPPLYPGNAWLYVSQATLASFIQGLAAPGQSTHPARRNQRTFSEAELRRAYFVFIADNPDAARDRWVAFAQAELNASVTAARRVWMENEPAGGRKSGPKATRH